MTRRPINPPAPPPSGDDRHERNYYRWANPIATLALLISCASAAFTGYQTWVTLKNTWDTQRAFVILRDLILVPLDFNKILVGYILIPQWENVGNTHASDLTYLVNYQFSRDDLPNGFSIVDTTKKVEGPTSLGPKEYLTSGAFRGADGNPVYFPQPLHTRSVAGKIQIHACLWMG